MIYAKWTYENSVREPFEKRNLTSEKYYGNRMNAYDKGTILT